MDQQYRFVCSIKNVPYFLTILSLCVGSSPGLDESLFLCLPCVSEVPLVDSSVDSALDSLCSLHFRSAFWYSLYPAMIVSVQSCLPIWTVHSLRGVAVLSFMPSRLTWHLLCVESINEGIHHRYVAFSLVGALDQTTEWIKESVHEELLSLSEAALTPGAENSSKPSLSPTLVLNNSYLKLLQWDYQKKELPEVSDFIFPIF